MTLAKQIDLVVAEQLLTFYPEKAVFWHEQSTLLLADVHAGKATHFRKNGIPLSTDYLLNDLNKIEELLIKTKAKKLLVLGDLFHTTANIENQLIEAWVDSLAVETELILGNHDVHSLAKSTIKTSLPYTVRPFFLSHEPTENEAFNIHGHLHPAFTMSGKGRTSIKLPAFYVGPSFITLPAFGSTTGKRMYAEIAKHSKIILIADDGVMAIN